MANNLKKKLIRENPVIARLQDPKYRAVKFLHKVNEFTNWKYPSEKQLTAVSRVMDEFDKAEKLQPLADLSRRTTTGKVTAIHKVARNKGFYHLLVLSGKDSPHTFLVRRTNHLALANVKVGDIISACAELSETKTPGTYFLRFPTKTGIISRG